MRLFDRNNGDYKAEHCNPSGILHGGALFSVMDSGRGAFVHYIIDEKWTYAATGGANQCGSDHAYLAKMVEAVLAQFNVSRARSGRAMRRGRLSAVRSVRDFPKAEDKKRSQIA